MNWNQLKKGAAGTALIFTLLLTFGMSLGTTAQAQGRYSDRQWDRDDRRDRDWNRREQIRRAREWEWRRERERARERDSYVYRSPRSFPYGGYSGGGIYNAQVDKGFRDGLDRGQEDARDRRSFNPNNSSHYRSGNSAYREGFRRGYEQGYRQYASYRRW
jgi:flagellar biosynthesis/type III secretory pathway protein FliH